jgi:molybdopterin-guanine dinucleotide biosynthesis protein A
MTMSSEISAVVLAGGRSTRLGLDKTKLRLDNVHTLIETVVSQMRHLSSDVIVVSDTVTELAGEVRCVKDVKLGTGCLRGLYTGLTNARQDYCLVVACDMPFLNTELLRYMLACNMA